MDVSSGASISALLSNRYDKTTSSVAPSETPERRNPMRVLDLCCCPGLKLCAIADQVPDGSTVIGVDISYARMTICTKIVEKYHVNKATSGRLHSSTKPVTVVQLYCQDGTSFGTAGVPRNLIFDSTVAAEESENKGNRKRKNKSARARERKRLRQIGSGKIFSEEVTKGHQQSEADSLGDRSSDKAGIVVESSDLFDHVLVDAECSTDGSLKHLRERLKGPDGSASNLLLTNKDLLADLVELQWRLLATGFRLLKIGRNAGVFNVFPFARPK